MKNLALGFSQVGILLDGLTVDKILPGSLASLTDRLQRGDKIIRINNIAISSANDVMNTIRDSQDFSSIQLTFEKFDKFSNLLNLVQSIELPLIVSVEDEVTDFYRRHEVHDAD